jgi:hypothetical protein
MLCDMTKARGSVSRAQAGGGLGKPGICLNLEFWKKIDIEKIRKYVYQTQYPKLKLYFLFHNYISVLNALKR